VRTAEGMKFIGWTPKPEKLRQCAGCQVVEGFHYIKNCRVRQCAMQNDLKNCAYCSEFPCSEVPTVSIADPIAFRANREEKLGVPISDENYRTYIEVYAGLNNLKMLQEDIKAEEIKEVKRVPYSPKIIDFPENVSLSKSQLRYFKTLHETLSSLRRSDLDIENSDLFAVQERLKKRADYVFGFLWLVVRHGSLKKKPALTITIDSTIYHSNKKGVHPGSKPEMEIVFNVLKKFGFKSSLIPLIEDQYLTGLGNLRKSAKGSDEPVWKIEISSDRIDLKTFQTYLRELEDKHGSRGYSAFKKVDMRLFQK
jgi:hypothetical protein